MEIDITKDHYTPAEMEQMKKVHLTYMRFYMRAKRKKERQEQDTQQEEVKGD